MQGSMFITCTPGQAYFGVRDLESHHITSLPEPWQALEQHCGLIRTMEQSGARVVNLVEMPGHPNAVFTRDTAVYTPHGAIMVRMGLPSRRGEEQWMTDELARLSIPVIGQIDNPGTVEGGDVILANNVAFIGHSSRTNRHGIYQLAIILRRLGYSIRTAKVPAPYLHLGGAMTLVAPETILTVKGCFPEDLLSGFRLIEVPIRDFITGNVIPLPHRQIIAEQSNQVAITRLQADGFTVFPLPLREFVKGTGGPSCLVLPLF